MKETIYTIPINEAFDLYEGCPMCRLYTDLEQASLDYIMGAAMMEPDVRIKTNELGFCHRHLHKMLVEKNKLSLALMIESRLPELDDALFERASRVIGKEPELKRIRETAEKNRRSCYVCDRISLFLGHYYDNIIYLWRKETDFRAKFIRQPFFCLEHYADLLERSGRGLPRKEQAAFINELSGICRAYLQSLETSVSEFCKSFDYRNAGQPLGEGAQTSVERAAAFLTGVKT